MCLEDIGLPATNLSTILGWIVNIIGDVYLIVYGFQKIIASTWELSKFHQLLLKSHHIDSSKKNLNSVQVENHGKQQQLSI